jgi:hypothetical protein
MLKSALVSTIKVSAPVGISATLAHAAPASAAALAMVVNVPEPSTMFLLAAGLVGIGVVAMRRK